MDPGGNCALQKDWIPDARVSVRMEWAASLDGEPLWSRCSARSSRSRSRPRRHRCRRPRSRCRWPMARRSRRRARGSPPRRHSRTPSVRPATTYGPYGQFDGAIVGGGPVCTRPFKAGENNGGATSPGVTKDKISVVYVLGNVPETRAQPAMNTQTGAAGTDEDAAHDLLLAMRPVLRDVGARDRRQVLHVDRH